MQTTNPIKPAKPYLRAYIARLLGMIDQRISRQLSEIMQHSRFQKLEASWRSLAFLVGHSRQWAGAKIQLLNINKSELASQVVHVLEFDQSVVFDKIYNEGFGMAGGEPFGVLIGDYEFANTPQDIQLLQAIAQIAAAAFAPFITGAAPALLGINHFTELGRLPDLAKIFQQYEYQAWQRLRQEEDARFVALTLPHYLLRLPYRNQQQGYHFQYHEPRPETGYLWGNAAYAFATVLLRNFSQSGWFGNIRGHGDNFAGGGCVPPAVASFNEQRLAALISTDAVITDNQEKLFSDLGFIPLCQPYSGSSALFYNNASIHLLPVSEDKTLQANRRASCLLQYLLCACRFAHYLKVIVRDLLGSFMTAEECEEQLNRWLLHYTAGNSDLGLAKRARFPLQKGMVKVREQPGMPGHFYCVMHLKPFFQLEQLHAEFIFITQVNHRALNTGIVP